MAVEIYINVDTGLIEKYEQVKYKKIIADFEITDSLVKDDATWEIVKIQQSIQWQNRLKDLLSQKSRTAEEEQEVLFLSLK